MTTDSPLWISTRNDDLSPFGVQTRRHLETRATRDPRLNALVTRLQEKGEEGSREWNWARRVCREGQRMMSDLHTRFTAEDENDILRLAAYMSDHSYAHFFTEYLNAPQDARGEYVAMIERISPIIADLQPNVAIGFAPQILEVYVNLGKRDMALAMFKKIAEDSPEAVMNNYARLRGFDNYDELMGIAETAVAANASQGPQQAGFAKSVRTRREAGALSERYGRK